MCGVTTLGRDLGDSPRVNTDVGIELGNTLDLGKELDRDLGEAPRVGTEVGTELGNTLDVGKEAEAVSGTKASSGTVATIWISSVGSTSCGQFRRHQGNPDEMQQKIHHQIQYQHLQIDLQRNQELLQVYLWQDLE